MKRLPLSRGKFALIDDDDFVKVSRFRWYVLPHYKHIWYAISTGNGKTIYLHRLIVNAPRGMWVDHVNGDGLDCRKKNLRIVTPSQNHGNRRVRCDSKSGIKGVSWNEKSRRWNPTIVCAGRRYSLGSHKDLTTAVLAYNAKAIELFGEYAKLNQVP